MPLDAILLSAVADELADRIVGSKIDKVQQPERDVLVFHLRGAQGPCRLLVSAGAGDARVHITEHRLENPSAPPMLCMLLRKHLTGARILGLKQPPAERLLDIELAATDMLGVQSEKHLIFEAIGRASNVILTDGENIIIDCMRRVGGELSDRRATLPGLIYRPPPAQDRKIDPESVTADVWQGMFDAGYSSKKEATVENWLLSAFSALSPLICRELSWRAYNDVCFRMGLIKDGGAGLKREFFDLVGKAKGKKLAPWSITGADGAYRDFSYTEIMQYEGVMDVRMEDSFSGMLDRFFTQKAQKERNRQRASATVKSVETAQSRIGRKIAAQKEELLATAGRDKKRQCGDLIMANLHDIKRGQSQLYAEDLFSGNGSIREIVLDPMKTPQQNAAKYYKDYTKAKNAEKHLSEQIKLGEDELRFLSAVLDEIALADGEQDLQDIRDELVLAGYIKAKKKDKEKRAASAPIRFVSTSGMQVLAGRSNIQNEKLTFQMAAKTDVWMHAQKIHGSHIIISCNGESPDAVTLQEAAAIAAYYSAARDGSKVPVDYTLVKRVKKMAGRHPGMVTYTDFKTITANPDGLIVGRLKR